MSVMVFVYIGTAVSCRFDNIVRIDLFFVYRPRIVSYRIGYMFRLSVSCRVDMIISYRLYVSFIGIVSHRFDNIVSI